MNGRFVVAPSRSRILARSVGYGVADSATVGAVVAAAIGLFVSMAVFNPFGIVASLIVGAPIAAAVGAVLGACCGLVGGLGLLLVRTHAAASRSAIRAVAACGAGLPPAAWSIALAAGSGHRFVPVVAALTVVTIATAWALGPRAFFGKSRQPRQRPRPNG